MFYDVERKVAKRYQAWQNLLFDKNALDEEFSEIGKIEDIDFTVKFYEIKPEITEKEKLENLRLRKELGLNTELELIKMDNPDMTDEDAEAKLLKIKEEKLNRMMSAVNQMINQSPNQPPQDLNQEEDKGAVEDGDQESSV